MFYTIFRSIRHKIIKAYRASGSGKKVTSEKARIREEVKRMKFLMPHEEKFAQAALVYAKIEAMPEFQKANTILMYWSMPDELPTHDFIVKWSESKTILLPVVKGKQMVVRKFTGIDDLKKGQFKTLEPGSGTFSRNIADLVIAPGIAFDKHKRRMGRGGGYYDRYLKNKQIPTWGIGFSFQLFDFIPSAPFDVQMTRVITPDQTVG